MPEHNSESRIMADVFQGVRNLTKMYLSKLPNIDVKKRYEINGIKLNSALWITGHLVWSEHYLLIEGLGGKPVDIPWLDKFTLGATPTKNDDLPLLDEILQTLDKVHDSAISQLLLLPGDELEKPNLIGATFGGKNTKRAIIYHAIRHEPMHIGQLSWILKANGIKFV
ncbi:MAG: DinB family protein [Ignavibacteria bacterium]